MIGVARKYRVTTDTSNSTTIMAIKDAAMTSMGNIQRDAL
jgi:hypothetical protein